MLEALLVLIGVLWVLKARQYRSLRAPRVKATPIRRAGRTRGHHIHRTRPGLPPAIALLITVGAIALDGITRDGVGGQIVNRANRWTALQTFAGHAKFEDNQELRFGTDNDVVYKYSSDQLTEGTGRIFIPSTVADIGTAIELAMTALPAFGGRISVEPGSYTTATAIDWPTGGKRIYLDLNGSLITYSGASTFITANGEGQADENRPRGEIYGGTIVGPGEGSATTGIKARAVHQFFTLTNVEIRSFGVGFHNEWDFLNTWHQVKAFDCGKGLLVTRNTSDSTVNNNVTTQNYIGCWGKDGATGLSIEGNVFGVNFVGCIFESNTTNDVHIKTIAGNNGPRNLQFNGCWMEGLANGVKIEDAAAVGVRMHNISFIGCNFQVYPTAGIDANDVEYLHVQDCTFYANTDNPVHLRSNTRRCIIGPNYDGEGGSVWRYLDESGFNTIVGYRSGETQLVHRGVHEVFDGVRIANTGSGRTVADAAITASTTSLSSATAAFTTADVGGVVTIAGAGFDGHDLVTTIATFVGATSVTISSNASTTVSGASLTIKPPDVTISSASSESRATIVGAIFVNNTSSSGAISTAGYMALRDGTAFDGRLRGPSGGLTATRTWRFPDTTGIVPILELAQTWTAKQTFSAGIDLSAGAFEMGSTPVLDASRQLSINLPPAINATYTLGTSLLNYANVFTRQVTIDNAGAGGDVSLSLNSAADVLSINGSAFVTGTSGLGTAHYLYLRDGTAFDGRIRGPSGGLTAARTYRVVDSNGTFAFIDVAQTFSALQQFNAGANIVSGGLQVAGTQVVGAQGAAVADAAGGGTVDTEARTALNALLARLRTHGLIAT